MRYEKSCGALVFRQDPRTGRRYVLMIRHKHGEKVHYSPMPGVSKEVVYFLSVTDQKATHPHDGEIADVEWVPLENAERSLTHENDKIVLRAALRSLDL